MGFEEADVTFTPTLLSALAWAARNNSAPTTCLNEENKAPEKHFEQPLTAQEEEARQAELRY